MKIQLVIISSGPILVSDEEAELGDIVYRQNKQGGYYKKVIAGVEGLPTIEMSMKAAVQYSPIIGNVYDVEVEMEEVDNSIMASVGGADPNQPKITNNTIKVTKIL